MNSSAPAGAPFLVIKNGFISWAPCRISVCCATVSSAASHPSWGEPVNANSSDLQTFLPLFCKQQVNYFFRWPNWAAKECSKGVRRVWKSYRGAVSAVTPVLAKWVGSLRNAFMEILHFQEIQSGVLISSFRRLREQETRPLRQKLTTSSCLRLPPNPKYLNFTLKTSSTRARSIKDKPWSIQTQSSLRNTVKSTHYIFCRALEFPSNFISIPASFLPTAQPFISPHVRSCHS